MKKNPLYILLMPIAIVAGLGLIITSILRNLFIKLLDLVTPGKTTKAEDAIPK